MNRSAAVQQLADHPAYWDVLIIGGGATGLGTAVDAAARGYRTALVEQGDFAQATSSRSTKLIHGGFRYLRQGNLGLVRESLRERGLLLQNAPHLVHRLTFIVPSYHWWEKSYYGFGLKLYDVLAGKLGIGRTQLTSRDETLRAIPTIETTGLRGGVRYFDGQFDDARLAICLAQTATNLGAAVVNYTRVQSLLKSNGRVCGAVVVEVETGREFEIRARVVINATGIFTDAVRHLDEPQAAPMLTVSQGAHIVLDRSFLPGDTALMVPKTDDGRVLFAIPWHGRTLIGTTDTPVSEAALEPRPLAAEIDFLLHHAGLYLAKKPTATDIRSTFAGLRPLVKTSGSKATAALARDHYISVSSAGLITITGGKWTTYRKMAADTVDAAIKSAGLAPQPCRTESLRLQGAPEPRSSRGHEAPSDRVATDVHSQTVSQNLVTSTATDDVLRAAREEMARTVEDVLSRRTRALLLDARATIEAAPNVAALLAKELGRDETWQRQQVATFTELARGYLP